MASEIGDDLAKLIHTASAGLDADAQAELAKLVGLMPELEALANPHASTAFEVAVAALLQKPRNLQLARKIRKDLERRLERRRLSHRLHGVVQGLVSLFVATTIAGIGLFLILGTCTESWCLFPKQPLGSVDHLVPLAVIGLGAAGGVISVLARLGRVVVADAVDPLVLAAVSFARPLIGMGFAFLVYLFLECKVLVIADIKRGDDSYFPLVLALAFVAGFSERLVPNVMQRVEQSVAQSGDAVGDEVNASAPHKLIPSRTRS